MGDPETKIQLRPRMPLMVLVETNAKLFQEGVLPPQATKAAAGPVIPNKCEPTRTLQNT